MKKALRIAVSAAAIAYPLCLLAVVLAFRFIGDRWWVTGVAIYLPRLAFALPLPILSVGLAMLGSRRLWGTQVFAALLVVMPLMGFVVPWPRPLRPTGPRMRVLSLNANSGYDGFPKILDAIDRYAPDLLLLQEIVVGPEHPFVQALKSRFPAVDATGQFIVASRFPLFEIGEPAKFAFEGRLHSPRYMRYVADTPLGRLAIYNVHPLSPRQAFYRVRGSGLRKEILSGRLLDGVAGQAVEANADLRAAELDAVVASTRADKLPVLIAGDTNLPTLHPIASRLGEGYRDGFVDAGWGFGYTFPANRPWMRIDRMFASPSLRFERFEVGCTGVSDHLCVTATLAGPR